MKRFVIVAALALAGNSALAAQQTPRADTVAVDSSQFITPGKAFYRSLLVPGWGQASVGAYVRGGTFFALQTSSAYMMLKTMAKIGEARQVEDRHTAAARDSLRALMEEDTMQMRILSDPAAFNTAVDSTPRVRQVRGLINSRKSQRQDWITYTVVWTLASAVDAFVAAHLADFPATLDAIPRPTGGTQLQITVPVGKHPR
ncbi:MAG: DUF5683 domain-containing protein [Gemmatimonadota bacterium]